MLVEISERYKDFSDREKQFIQKAMEQEFARCVIVDRLVYVEIAEYDSERKWLTMGLSVMRIALALAKL